MDDGTERAVETARERLPDDIAPRRVVFGFDGYLDRVREVVADRSDPTSYERLPRLAQFRDRLDRSVEAGSSLSYEWLEDGRRTGGHTCHLARAFGTWDFAPTLVGMYGDPVHETFEREFGEYDLHSIGEPGVTDAVEFDDGKLMLTEIGATMTLDWAGLDDRFGHDRLAERLDGAALLGVGYWSETPNTPTVLSGLRELWTGIDDPPGTVLVDPGDVRKLDPDRLRSGREAIRDLTDVTDVVVSANRAETDVLADAYAGEADRDFEAAADAVFDALAPTWVVGHGIDRSVVVTADGTASVAVPTVAEPAMTTSSGDHFNAGLALGRLSGLDPAAAVVVGNAVAGHFVRTADQPSLDDVRAFVDDYLAKF